MIALSWRNLQKNTTARSGYFKVNTDAEQELAQLFQIRSIPAVMFIPKTGQPTMSVGALPKESFKKIINDVTLN